MSENLKTDMTNVSLNLPSQDNVLKRTTSRQVCWGGGDNQIWYLFGYHYRRCIPVEIRYSRGKLHNSGIEKIPKRYGTVKLVSAVTLQNIEVLFYGFAETFFLRCPLMRDRCIPAIGHLSPPLTRKHTLRSRRRCQISRSRTRLLCNR